MFERYTERARKVVVLGQEEARSLKHHYIGTEHILLGLLRVDDGMACVVLNTLGVELEPVRGQVARIVGQGDEVVTGQIPFTPRAKKVLELSLREALGLGHNYIGTEHILLGLVRENEGVAAHILDQAEVTRESIRDEIMNLLTGPTRAADPTIAEASYERLLAEVIERARQLRDDANSRDKRELALVVTNLEQAALWHCQHRAMAHLGDQALLDWLLEV